MRLEDVWIALQAACGPQALPEEIHRLRVATRRGTAVISAFRELIPSKERAWFRKRLARVRRTAGKARDLDLLAGRVSATSGKPRRRLVKALSKLREKSRRPLGKHLSQLVAKDWRHRVDRLLEHVRGCHGIAFGTVARRRLAPLAESFLQAASGSLRRPEELHALRIRCKKLRYVLEIFSPALPAAAARDRCRKSLERLQETLGDFTDHVAAAQRLDRWAYRAETGTSRDDLLALVDDEWQRAAAARKAFRTWWNRSRRRALRHGLEITLRRRFA
jgi:CHAD domain-containing protein